MDRPVASCRGERFCVVHDGVKLLSYIDKVVLRQDTRNSLLASIGFNDCFKGMVELRDYRGG